MPSARTALILSALFGAAAIALGAFGAHALQGLLESTGRAGTWQTATFYHLVHAVALVWLATLPAWDRARAAWICLAAGVAIFSGSLYLLCLTRIAWLGAITPVGGVLMIAGWLLLLRLAASVQK